MRRTTIQLAWPFALIGIAVGAQLPAAPMSSLTMALALGLFGALVSSALERVQDWQVALMAPSLGATTGAALGFGAAGFHAGLIASIAGVGFGLLALPALLLITDGARRIYRLPRGSLLARAQKRRVWLLALASSTLASLMVPALADPWARPAEAPLAQLCALGTMLMALVDAVLWLAMAQMRARRAQPAPIGHPYREAAAPSSTPQPPDGALTLPVLAASALLYDALLVAVVAAALMVSR